MRSREGRPAEISAWPLRERRARGRRIYYVGPVGQREQWESDRGRCAARLSARVGGVPDGQAHLVSEVKRALRMVLGRPRGLGRAVHWAERERSGLGRAGLEGLGWPAWELGRSAGLRGERGKEELGWVAWVEARLGFPFFSILFLFYFKHHSNLFEFKTKFEFKTLCTQPKKTYAPA